MRTALALSGGGLRATLFHLGVLYRMHRAGELREVTSIFSVSGGSILAAHLRLHWKRYTGTEAEFLEAAGEVRKLCGRDLRGRVVRRAGLCWLLLAPQALRLAGRAKLAERLGPAAFLIREYDRFLDGAKLPAAEPGAPALHVLATSLNTGEACAFENDRFRLRRQKPVRAAAGEISLAAAVAASSAYPALFAPVRVDPETVPGLTETHYLSDGGLFDNLGIVEMLAEEQSTGEPFERILVSDAGAEMSADRKTSAWGIFRRAIRTSDILMTRMADGARLQFEKDPRVTVISIHKPVEHSEIPAETQRTICRVRTDLDVFTSREQTMIVNHGIEAASQELYQGQPVNSPEPAGDYPLHRSAKPSLLGLLHPLDWASWAAAAVLALWVIAFSYGLAYRDLRHDYGVARRAQFEGVGDAVSTLINQESGSADWARKVETLRFTEFWEHPDLPEASLASRIRVLRLLTRAQHEALARLGFDSPFAPLNRPEFDTGRDCVASQTDEASRTNAVLDYAHAVGHYWQGSEKSHFKDTRDRHYLRVTRLVDQLTHSARPDSKLVEEFHHYYYGRLLPVESQATAPQGASVEHQMVEFRNLLLGWQETGKRPEGIEKARDELVNLILQEHATEPPAMVLNPEYCMLPHHSPGT